MSNEIKTRKAPQKVNQTKFAELVLWANEKRAEINAELAAGKSTKEYAEKHDVAQSTINGLFDALNIKYGRDVRPAPQRDVDAVIAALLVVVARLSHENGISYEEIRPFLK